MGLGVGLCLGQRSTLSVSWSRLFGEPVHALGLSSLVVPLGDVDEMANDGRQADDALHDVSDAGDRPPAAWPLEVGHELRLLADDELNRAFHFV